MSFGWLGTFRQGQWEAYRSFILQERADVSARMRVIDAELNRIGLVTVYYAQDDASQCTEERVGFSVSEGSTLEKLIRAYTVLGGNPFDVSLYLVPDSVELIGDTYVQHQPYGGVIAPRKGDPAINATRFGGGDLVVLKYPVGRTNGGMDKDTTTAMSVERSRRWLGQVIDERIHSMEARIIKQCDLREQLLQEKDLLIASLGGSIPSVGSFDRSLYAVEQSVPSIVAAIDAIFYEPSPNGEGYLSGARNEAALALFPNLMDDILPDEANTIL